MALKKEIEDAYNAELLWDKINVEKSHVLQKHSNRSLKETLNAILSDQKNISVFYNDDIAKTMTEETVSLNITAIEQFMKDIEPKKKLYLAIDCEDYENVLQNRQYSGHMCIYNVNKNTIQYGESNDIITVIGKNNTELGFYVKTSYLDENGMDVKPIPDLDKILQETEVFKKANPVKKAYYERQCQFKQPMSLFYTEDRCTGNPLLKCSIADRVYTINHDNSCSLEFKNKNGNPMESPYSKISSSKTKVNLMHPPIRERVTKDYPADMKQIDAIQKMVRTWSNPDDLKPMIKNCPTYQNSNQKTPSMR